MGKILAKNVTCNPIEYWMSFTETVNVKLDLKRIKFSSVKNAIVTNRNATSNALYTR